MSDDGPSRSFPALGLRGELTAELDALGYEEPTPIQLQAIPSLLEGRDLVGQAATGTGKTAAFALPLLQRIVPGGAHPQALVLAPTRELAVQVAEAVQRYGRRLGARVLAVYGGQPVGRQIRALESGVDVVVATPGRALDHLARGTLALTDLAVVVLDEADEMLDMGFADDIEAILAQAPDERQTVLFSATLPARINGLVRRYLRDPVRIRIARETGGRAEASAVRHVAYLVRREHKSSALGRLLDVEQPGAALVFCRTREGVDALSESLLARGYRSEVLHGGIGQDQRERVMQRVRSGAAEVLVATDVAARGLDIDVLTHVVNYDLPTDVESFTHRVGRVGRAGRDGVAITLVEPRQHRLLKQIEKATRLSIPVATLPTVADLRNRRLELTRAALEEALREDEVEAYRGVVEPLTDDFDLMQIALAAVKLLHEGDPADEEEIPSVAERSGDTGRPGTGRGTAPAGRPRPDLGPTERVFVSLGHAARIRPQDLVGAIANETSLSGRRIGAIEITSGFSVVEVPREAAAEVIEALRATLIKGRKARVELYRPRRDRAGSGT